MSACRFPKEDSPFFYSRPWLTGGLLLVGLGLFGVCSYSLATHQLLYPTDLMLSRQFTGPRDSLPGWLSGALTWLANIASVGPNLACLYLCWRWLRGKCNDRFTLILSSYAVGLLLFWSFALLFNRTRPALPGLLKSLPFPSYPSGHMIQTITLLAPLLYLYLPGMRLGMRWLALLAAGAYTLLIGFDRLILNAHYFTDVLGGTGLGLFWAVFVLAGFELYHLRAVRAGRQAVSAD
jgi:membrane-associated phospholipid phosphatase